MTLPTMPIPLSMQDVARQKNPSSSAVKRCYRRSWVSSDVRGKLRLLTLSPNGPAEFKTACEVGVGRSLRTPPPPISPRYYILQKPFRRLKRKCVYVLSKGKSKLLLYANRNPTWGWRSSFVPIFLFCFFVCLSLFVFCLSSPRTPREKK